MSQVKSISKYVLAIFMIVAGTLHSLFAVLHDSRRINEVADPEHGPRAAEFAAELRGSVFDLEDHEFRLLYRACEGHTHERNHPDVTIQTCWDSDRLDLGRVGIMPHPSRLCTEVAKRSETIKWADGRASFGIVPTFVLDELYACTRPGGGCLLTVRDYDQEERGMGLIKSYGVTA